MAYVSPEIAKLVDDATEAFRASLTKMLVGNALGEIAAVVGFDEVKVIERPQAFVWRRKRQQRGHYSAIEKVGQA